MGTHLGETAQTPRIGTVLIVDDDESARKLTEVWLSRAGFTCLHVNSGRSALDLLVTNADQIDAVVLDIQMPGLDGFEVLKQLKAIDRVAYIPVILVSAHAVTEEHFVRGVYAGAFDQLAKPFTGALLIAKVRLARERVVLEREIRSIRATHQSHGAVDPTTGFFDQPHLLTRLNEQYALSARHKEPFSLARIELDQYDDVSSRRGRIHGDRVAVHVAKLLRANLRTEDIVFRVQPNEFIVLMRSTPALGAVIALDRMRARLAVVPLSFSPTDIETLTATVGIAAIDASTQFAPDDLLTRSKTALDLAKSDGRNRVVHLAPKDPRPTSDKRTVVNPLS